MSNLDYIKKAIEEAEKYFEKINFEQLLENDFPASNLNAAWKGRIFCNNLKIEIIVGLPDDFPDALPKVYLTKNFEYFPIPHVDSVLFVCTFETESIDFFSENIHGLIHETIEKARKIITDGIQKTNQEDFKYEFLAYWDLEKIYNVHSIFEPNDRLSIKYIAQIKSNIKGLNYLVGESENHIKEYLKKIDFSGSTKNLKKCLYIPLSDIPIPPYPVINKQFLSLIGKSDSSHILNIVNFIKENLYEGIIIFSFKTEDDYLLAA